LRSPALFALAALMLFSPETARAQFRGIVEGTVTSEAGAPVVGASVALGAPARLARTDSLGHYAFDRVPLGDQRVEFRALGFKPAARLAEVRTTDPLRVDVVLEVSVVTLPDVVVSTTRDARLASRTAMSVQVIGTREIAEARAHHPADIVNRAPGVYVNNAGGEGHFTAIRQPISTKALYAYLEDGVPTRSTGFFNHNALYEINLPQAGRIEVIKGPGSAIYGSDAVGGVVNSFTRAPSATPEAELFVEGGSATYLRALGTASGQTGASGLRADVNFTTSDGWRDGAPYDRQSGTVRWDLALGTATRLKTVASVSHIDQPGDGGSDLPLDDFEHQPTRVYTPIAFRRVVAARLSSELQLQRGASTFGATVYTRYNTLDLMPSWQLSFDPQVWESTHRSLGLLARYQREVAELNTSISTGVDLEYSPGSRLETEIIPTRDGPVFTSYTTGDVQYDYDVTFRQVAPYAQADIALLPSVQLDAGLRFDNLGYSYENRLEPLAAGRHRRPASTDVGFARLSPKLGVAWEVGPSVSVFGSFRTAFRSPSESQLFRQGSAESTVDLEPVKAESYEAGVRALVGGIATVEATVYAMKLHDDILTFFNPADGLRLTQNAGSTTHRGIEVGIGVSPVREVRLAAAVSYARHRYDTWQPSVTEDYSGNEMELAPRVMTNARITWRPEALRGGLLALEWVRLGSYYMDPANTHTYDGHNLFNVQANVPVLDHLQVTGRVTNLADVRFAETSSYNAQQGEQFRPGTPRQVFVGAQYRLGQ
jgi:outer membrane receptor protein involved in Fe transport